MSCVWFPRPAAHKAFPGASRGRHRGRGLPATSTSVSRSLGVTGVCCRPASTSLSPAACLAGDAETSLAAGPGDEGGSATWVSVVLGRVDTGEGGSAVTPHCRGFGRSGRVLNREGGRSVLLNKDRSVMMLLVQSRPTRLKQA
ncbi:hypothetical protein E2C01_101731 [Portunus trituberculatus]|uniref:Uncharacterized protein n=1 Tax=Portunus trituberculatus TaxID=210409 RepID=A0A5B7KGG2_PORTR|nr:hypothetical protein [Portunus trituberculatus]